MKNENGTLVLGRFRKGTKVAKLVLAISSKSGASKKELRKLDGPKFMSRVYGVRRILGKSAAIDISSDRVRLLTKKRKAA